ncbi:MAG: MBL fold metallo-hydrolase [Enterocloster sp.]
MVQITALMDNKLSENKALIAEHGLSLLIEKDGFRMLFDCGAGEAVWYNSHKLGKNVSELDAVVLSHSHYDHAAGYRDLIEMGEGSSVLYTGPHFFEPKYAYDGRRYADLSAGFGPDFLKENGIEHRVCGDIMELASGIWLVGGFPGVYGFETIPSRFVKLIPDKLPEGIDQAMVPDSFEDEICIAIETKKGLIVLVGCSHPGILNMISRVHDALGRPVYGVYGGTHLVEAEHNRICETVKKLKEMGLSVLGMSHCSGDIAEDTISLDKDVLSCHMAVGDTVFFD